MFACSKAKANSTIRRNTMVKEPILIVDDEKNIRLTMSQSLEPLKIPVRTAVNGEEALAKAS
jgi:CheY-like chemotaxis protein